MSYFGKVAIEYKGDADLVTRADRNSEKLIVEQIRRRWPEHDLIGEEGSRNETGSDYRWYIDPLDGTTNFAHGYPVFCVSMALEYKGERIAGVIYDPNRDEMFAAEKGSGSRLNAVPIACFADSTPAGKPGGYRISQPQTPQEPQHPLLSSAHAALPWRAPRRLCRTRSLLCLLRTLRWFLGVQPEFLGHRRRSVDCAGSRRHGNQLQRPAVFHRQSPSAGQQQHHP